MKSNIILATTLSVLFILSVGMALAESGNNYIGNGQNQAHSTAPKQHKTVQERVNNQALRIGNGVVNKKLTSDEMARVQAEQQKIKDMQAAGASEADIQKELNKASKQIYKLKHNNNSENRQKVVGKKFDNLKTRLGKGVADGSLTAKEAERIGAAIDRVQELEDKKVANNGKLSQAEEDELKKKQAALSKMVYKNRHDNQGANNTSAAPAL